MSADNLIGLGMPPALAGALSGNVTTITCAGTNQGGATLITSKCSILNAASGSTGGVFPSSTQKGTGYFEQYMIVNGTISTASAVVYAPSGGFLNGTTNGSATLAAGRAAIAWEVSSGVWNIMPSTP